MKKSFLWFLTGLLLLASSAVYLAACSDSGGGSGVSLGGAAGGGVSTFARGAVTGTGSLMVNGMDLNTDSANFTVNGNTGAAVDMKEGQVVSVRGSAAGSSGAASDVLFANEMTGPISAISGTFSSEMVSSGTMTVLGQTVKVDGNTNFQPDGLDLSTLGAGTVVEVSGFPDGQGTLVATFVQVRPDATEYNIRGIVSAASGSTFTLIPNGNGNPLQVTLASGTTGTAGTGTGAGAAGGGTGTAGISDGQFVDVKIDPATFTPGSTTVTAKNVSVESGLTPREGDAVFLEGFPSNIGGNTFDMGGIRVNAGSQTMPESGQRIAVHGKFTNGTLDADMIAPAGAAELTMGPITSVTGTGTAGAGGTGAITGINIYELWTTNTATATGTGTSAGAGAGGTASTNINNPFYGNTGTGAGTAVGTGTGGTAPANVNSPFYSNTGTGAGTGTSTGTGAGGTGTGISTGGTGTTGAGAGGTGTVSSATGTMQMVVNGTTFDIGQAAISMNGKPASFADLVPGKQVIVKSIVNNFASIMNQGAGIGSFGTGTDLGTGGTGTAGPGTGIGTGSTGTGAGGAGTLPVQQVACPPAGTFDVTIQDFSFTPANVTVPANTTVKWTNSGPSPHTVTNAAGATNGTFDSGILGAGSSVCFTFTVPGTFNYFCTLHPFMTGSVTVQDNSGAAGAGTGGTGAGITSGGTGTGVSTGGTGTFGTGGAGTGGSAGVQRAVAIWIIDNLHGPVTAMTGSLTSTASGTVPNSTNTQAELTVFEQTVVVDGFTRFGAELQNMLSSATGSVITLQTGSVVEVSGTPDGSGDLLATLLETRPTATEYHVRGIVTSTTGSPVANFTLTPVPEGTPLTVSLASGATTTAKITEGMTVNVLVDPATFTPGSTSITAKAVDPVYEPIPSENDIVNMQGFISDVSGNSFTMNGMNVRAESLPTTGTDSGRVRVRGTVSGGTITASDVAVQ